MIFIQIAKVKQVFKILGVFDNLTRIWTRNKTRSFQIM